MTPNLAITTYPTRGLTEPALRNWKLMPPNGGWGVTIAVDGVDSRIDGDPLSIAEQIYKKYALSRNKVGHEAIWDFLNWTWVARDPSRLIEGAAENFRGFTPINPSPKVNMALEWLSIFAEDFESERWKMVLEFITKVVDPSHGSTSADASFHEKLTKARILSDPMNITSAEEVRAWLPHIS